VQNYVFLNVRFLIMLIVGIMSMGLPRLNFVFIVIYLWLRFI